MTPTAPELLAAAALDICIGDPRWLPHPIRALGRVIARLEPLCRATGLRPRIAGVFFWFATMLVATAAVAATLLLVPRPYSYSYWIFALLAVRDLDLQSWRAVKAVRDGDLALARARLAHIVGRDTQSLDEPEIVRAAVETVAENLSDAVVAPLFYLALAGPIGMAAYKAVNTMDSTVGYRSERYRDFGWFAARADDAANYIPARITAALICLCAILPGFRLRDAVRIAFRDARSQPSPNAGWPEAAAAGALGVQLGGLNYYHGAPTPKQRLGDPVRPLSAAIFPRVRLMLYATSALAVALAAGALP
jgi:adenosylcobinamide-phosphate synthase